MVDALPLAGCCVLVVEDEYFIGDDLDRSLLNVGAQVIGTIGNLDAALKQVKLDGFEIAVIDLNLRYEMAFPIADELKRQNVPFVFATGYNKSVIPTRFADVTRWEKPFDELALVADLARLCSGVRAC